MAGRMQSCWQRGGCVRARKGNALACKGHARTSYSSSVDPTTSTSLAPSPKSFRYAITGGVTSTVTATEWTADESSARLRARQRTMKAVPCCSLPSRIGNWM